jgi:hypothetical protein
VQVHTRFANLFALLLLTLGLSVQGAGLSSAAELSLIDFRPTVATTAEVATEQPAQWRSGLYDAPCSEITALEAEVDGEPAAVDTPSVIRPVFSRTASLRSDPQMPQGATATYIAKFASSPVLARAPPPRAHVRADV